MRTGVLVVSVLVAFTVFGMHGSIEHGGDNFGELEIITNKCSYAVGEPVEIAFRNIGDGYFEWRERGVPSTVPYSVHDEEGDLVFKIDILPTVLYTLSPGEEYNLIWNQTYDTPGRPTGLQVPKGGYEINSEAHIGRSGSDQTMSDSAWIWIGEPCGGLGPDADAGPDQTVYEGDVVQFNGTGSGGSGYNWHRLDVNFATDSALYLRTIDPLGPYRGGWEGGVMEWVTFKSSLPFWIAKKAGHLGQGPAGKEYTYYWMMHDTGNFTLTFLASNGGFYASVYDENNGMCILSSLHVRQGSNDAVRYLNEGHVYRLDIKNTSVESGFPNDLDVLFELNETDILLTPERESLVFYKSLSPFDLETDSSGVTEITFYSRGEQVFFAYYASQLNHSEVEVSGGEIALANPPYNTGITPGEYYDTLLGDGKLSLSWDFDSGLDSDGDGSTTNDVEATGLMPTHVYPDNGVYNVTLTVTDDSGNSGTDTCVVTVLNVAPAVDLRVLPVGAEVSLRIAGEKWHDVSIELYEENAVVAKGSLTRFPGSPNDQMLYLTNLDMNFSRTYSAIIRYTPEDDTVNGQPNGANPCWMILTFDDGVEVRLHHNFIVNNPDRYVWVVDLTAVALKRGLTFEATAYDPGMDDLTFEWGFGDGSPIVTSMYPNGGTFPFTATDSQTHAYINAGVYDVSVRVSDDDGGICELVLTINVT